MMSEQIHSESISHKVIVNPTHIKGYKSHASNW